MTRRIGGWKDAAVVALALGLAIGVPAQAMFQAGQAIEYRVRGSVPPRWERGVMVRELPEGKQYLIREKPTRFFPEGFESAYAVADVRLPQPASKPAPTGKPGVPAAVPPAPAAAGLLSKEQVVAYAKQLFGEGEPFANPRRDELLAQIRDYIRSHGTSFSVDNDFRDRMGAQGTMSVHISYAVTDNRGKPPQVKDYFGAWLLRAANRGSKSVTADGKRVVTTDSQAESGRLTINPNGTYMWELLRGDPPAKWLRGRWREVKPEELNLWEGGPALWLEKAKQGYDYMVRMGRDPAWPGWIDVGAGKARTPVEYGRRG